MIKIHELKEVRPVTKYTDAEECTLDVLQEWLESCAREKAVPVAFERDTVKDGIKSEECLLMHYPNYKWQMEEYILTIDIA